MKVYKQTLIKSVNVSFHLPLSNNLCLFLSFLICLRCLSSLQWKEEAAGEHRQSHPVQHERQEVHDHRGAKNQPITARLHQEPIRLHPGCSWKLKWNKPKKSQWQLRYWWWSSSSSSISDSLCFFAELLIMWQVGSSSVEGSGWLNPQNAKKCQISPVM